VHRASVVVRDKTTIAYAVSGTSKRRRVVLVNSLALDSEFWRSVDDRLGDHASVLTIDCRGHGASDNPAGSYSVEHSADDLADVMDAAGWTSAGVASASMGGCVAISFAVRHWLRATALGLFDSTAWYGVDAPKHWQERVVPAAADCTASLIEFQKTRWFGDAFRAQNSDVVDRTVSTLLKTDPKAYAEMCRILGAVDLRTKLGGLRMPTRIGVGEDDYATLVEMAKALQTGITGSELNIISGGRHLTPLEFSEAIATEIDLLLEGSRMIFTGKIDVPAPPAAVFAKSHDAHFFASCVDGVEYLVEIDDRHYTATLDTRVAYIKFKFAVAVELDEPMRVVAKAEGSPARMVGRLTATSGFGHAAMVLASIHAMGIAAAFLLPETKGGAAARLTPAKAPLHRPELERLIR
jgi:3-oxoadipate enol-lactonase